MDCIPSRHVNAIGATPFWEVVFFIWCHTFDSSSFISTVTYYNECVQLGQCALFLVGYRLVLLKYRMSPWSEVAMFLSPSLWKVVTSCHSHWPSPFLHFIFLKCDVEPKLNLNHHTNFIFSPKSSFLFSWMIYYDIAILTLAVQSSANL